jgi:alpha-N-arabinofuranosidase
MAGIKFHGAIDAQITRNHIYRTCLGLWLDWMAQGTRVSDNLFHNNDADVLVEVDHGPFLLDNNLFLSRLSLMDRSQGGAYVHNLFAGTVQGVSYDGRQTPFLKAHSTRVAGYHDNPGGDDRFYNNLFVGRADLRRYDKARLPVWMDGNVFLHGAMPSTHETNALVQTEFIPALKLAEEADGLHLEMRFDPAWNTARTRKLVTTELLGRAIIPNAPFEQPDGARIRINTDYFGQSRNESNPTPGPFERPGQEDLKLKVWNVSPTGN